MYQEIVARQGRLGHLKSYGIVGIQGLLLIFLAHILGGYPFSVAAFFAGILSWFLTPTVTPSVVLHFYKGVRVPQHRYPGLHSLLNQLSHRANLPNLPELWLLPSFKPIAFATGDKKSSAVALSEGILERLDPHELAGVVAHELSHIANEDSRITWFSVITVKIIHLLSILGQLMVLVQLPSVIRGEVVVSFWLLAILVLAPFAATLLQLALMRTREFAADMGSARILGSAEPLMRALRKLDGRPEGFMGLMKRKKEQKGHTLFRTHPPVKDRLKRLMMLSGMGATQMAFMDEPKSGSRDAFYLPGAILKRRKSDLF